MRFKHLARVSLALIGIFPAAALALDELIPIEGLSEGSPVGQDGWHIVTGGGVGVTVDSSIFSPNNGSTQSISLRGNNASGNRVARPLSQTFSSGLWRVGYDVYISPREPGSPTNLVCRTIMYLPGESNQLIQPYIQDGGNDLPAQNGFADPDGLGPTGYGGMGFVTNFFYTTRHWYRFEYDINFDDHSASNFSIYDIEAAIVDPVASNSQVVYLRNDNFNFFGPLGSFGLGLDVARESEGFNVDNFSLTVAQLWIKDGSGSWSDSSNFRGGLPDGPGATANFLYAITSPATVALDGDRSVGNLTFDNLNAYTLAGPGALTMDNAGATANIKVYTGQHEILVPVNILDSTTALIENGASLKMGDGLNIYPSRTLTKTGAGELSLNTVQGGFLNIEAGTVRILPTSAAAKAHANAVVGPTANVLEGLNIASGATLDLTDNDLIIQATAGTVVSSFFDLSAQIASARNTGATPWTGSGLTSSTAALDATGLVGLGIIYNNDGDGNPVFTEFDGVPVDTNSVLIKYTWTGDADLSGHVDADDYFLIDSGFARGLNFWYYGDFDYSGAVDADDYFLIDSAFSQQGEPLGAVAVPEPGAAAAFLLAVFAAAGRRRRRVMAK